MKKLAIFIFCFISLMCNAGESSYSLFSPDKKIEITVGVTANVTSLVSVPGRLLLVLFMYFGRVGVLTLSLGFLMVNRAEERFRYAQTNLLIG